MGVLLHYFLLVSFMWMFIEGVQLYRMTMNVFNVLTTKWTLAYIALAYTIPILIVGITVICASQFARNSQNETACNGVINVYAGDETYNVCLNILLFNILSIVNVIQHIRCWLHGEQWLWSFSGPVAAFLLVCIYLNSMISKRAHLT